jgi:ABC-type multidrug transport system permease subunit
MKRFHSWLLDSALACIFLGFVILIFGSVALNLSAGLLIAFGVVLLGILLGVEP